MTDTLPYDVLRFEPDRRGGTAVLAAADRDEEVFVVNGVAIGEGDTTRGMSGKPTYYGADVLRDAVDLLAGVPIVRDHPGAEKTDEGVRVTPQPPVESILGEVTDAKYRDGVGLLWQGELDDPEIARQVERGRVAVSPILGRDLDQWSNEKEAYIASEITGFRDLGVVARGASPGASIEPGGTPTQTAAAMSADALAAAFDQDVQCGADPAESGHNPHQNKSTMSDSDQEAKVAQLTEQLEAEREQRENLADENTEMKAVFADALAEQSPFDAETIAERFTYDEIRENFDGDPAEALTVEPVSGSSGGGLDPDTGVDALSRDEEEELEVLQERKRLMRNRGLDSVVEQIDGEIEALVGTEGGEA
jgi:hypothetical protein